MACEGVRSLGVVTACLLCPSLHVLYHNFNTLDVSTAGLHKQFQDKTESPAVCDSCNARTVEELNPTL